MLHDEVASIPGTQQCNCNSRSWSGSLWLSSVLRSMYTITTLWSDDALLNDDQHPDKQLRQRKHLKVLCVGISSTLEQYLQYRSIFLGLAPA